MAKDPWTTTATPAGTLTAHATTDTTRGTGGNAAAAFWGTTMNDEESCWCCERLLGVNGFRCPVCAPLSTKSRTLFGYDVWVGPDGGCVVAGMQAAAHDRRCSLTVKPLPGGGYKVGYATHATLPDAIAAAEASLQWAGAKPSATGSLQ